MEDKRCAADGENKLFVDNEDKNINNCRSVVKLANIFKQQKAFGNADGQELFPLENDTQVLDTVVSEAVNHEDSCLFEATGTVSHSTTIVASSSPYLENNDSFPRLSNENIPHSVNDVENVLNVGFIQDSNNTTMVDMTQYDFDNSEDFSNNSCRVIVETDQEKLDLQMNRQEDIDEIPKCDQGRNYNTSVNTIPESDLSCSVSNLNDVLKSENLITLACNSEQFIDLNISQQVDVSDEIFDISSLFEEICTKECISNDVLLSFHENGLLILKDKELCSLMEEIIDEDMLSVVFKRASSNAGNILTLDEDKVLEVDDNYGETSDQVGLLEFEGTESLLEENKSVDLKHLTSIFGKEDKISNISLLDPETHLKDNYNGEVDEKIFEIKSEKLLKGDEEKEEQMKGEGTREATLKPSLSTIIEEEEHICYSPSLIEKTDIGLSSHEGGDEEENLNFERKFMIKGDEPLALGRLTSSIIEAEDDFRDIPSVDIKGEDLLENGSDHKYLQYGGKQISSKGDGKVGLRRHFSSPIEYQDEIVDNPLIEKDLKDTNTGESNEGDLQIKSEKSRKNYRPDALRTPPSSVFEDDDDMSDISSQERKVGASRNDREKIMNYRGDGSVTSRTSSFYGHDDRVFLEYNDGVNSSTGTQISDSVSYVGMDEVLKPIRGRSSGKLWTSKADIEDRWCHDLYVEEDQMPKTAQELIEIYGYDIRKEESCPEFKQRTRIVYNSGKRTSDTRRGGDRSRFDQRNGNNGFSSNSYKNTGKGDRNENQRYAQQEAGKGYNPPNSYKIKRQVTNQESENQTRIYQREAGSFSSKNYKIPQKLGSGDQPRLHQQEAGNSCSSPSNGYIERQFEKHLIDVEEERFEYYYPKDLKRREFKLEDSVMCLEANVSSTKINTSGNFERAGNSYVFSNSYNEQHITGEHESEDHKYQWKAGNNYTFPCDTHNARQYQEKKLTANNNYFEYCYPEYFQNQQGLKMGDATRKDPNVNLTSMVGLKNYFSRGSRINEHFVSPNKSESLRTEYEQERRYDFEEHKYLHSSQYKTEMNTVSSTREIHDKSSNLLLPTKTGLRIPDCNTHMRTPFPGNDSATMLGRFSNFVRTGSRNPVQRRPSSENDSTTMLDRFSNSVGTGPIYPDRNTYLRRPSSENDSTTMPDRFSNFVRIGPKNTDRNTHLRRPFFKNERSVAEKFENVNVKKMEPSALSSKMIRNALNELDLNSYKKEAPKSPMVVTNQSRRYSTQRNRALPELKMMDEV